MTTISNMLANATTMILEDSEAIQIIATFNDEKYVLGQGEETGESYKILFDEIDIETTIFYRSSMMNTNEYTPANIALCENAKLLFTKLLAENPRKLLKTLEYLDSLDN